MKKLLATMGKSACLLTLGVASTYASQSYIVKVKEGASLLPQKNITIAEKMNVSFGNFYSVIAEDKVAVDSISANPDVLYIEENQEYTYSPVNVGAVLEDASYSKQWGLKNTGKNSGPFWAPGKKGEDINAEGVWKLSRGSNELKIAVIDTGVDHTHKDLKANMWVNEAEKNGEAGVDDDGNGYVDDIHGYDFANNDGDPKDGHGHGTHCAGIIGAVHDRNGVRGVMNKVKIIGIKFLTDKGSGTTENAIKSIDYAIKVGANVMSNSWGGGGFSQALKDSIIAANEAGIIFVAAAGNSRRNNDTSDTYPANYEVENVISVGAMDGAGKKASFSNYGKKTVHVFAPGKDIISTVKNNGYQKMSGTSMATPFVSGAMGLLLSRNPNMSPAEAREQLTATSVKNGSLDSYTVSGRMDALRLVKNLR